MAQNANPKIYTVANKVRLDKLLDAIDDENEIEPLTASEVFEYIRNLNDPEHPLTLEQLNVVNLDHVSVNDAENTVLIQFTPTIPHCSMATLIGLCIRVKLMRSLPQRFKVTGKLHFYDALTYLCHS